MWRKLDISWPLFPFFFLPICVTRNFLVGVWGCYKLHLLFWSCVRVINVKIPALGVGDGVLSPFSWDVLWNSRRGVALTVWFTRPVFSINYQCFYQWSIWFSGAPRREKSIRRVGKEAGQPSWLIVLDGCPTGWLLAANRMGRLAGSTQQRSSGTGRKVIVHCLGSYMKGIRVPSVHANTSQALTPPLGWFPIIPQTLSSIAVLIGCWSAESRACPWQERELRANTDSSCVFSSPKSLEQQLAAS